VTDLWLGIIAVAVSAMAVSQVALAIAGIRAARQLQALARRLEEDVKPLVAQVQTIAADVARTSALAATQIERVDAMTLRLSGLVDEATSALSQGILAPLRDGLALVRAFIAAFGGPRPKRPSSSEGGEVHD
jgi:hypothetical protein